jgi:hypothetical protein
MEIILELENSDLVIEFDSNILYENYSDRTEVQWRFHDGTSSGVMADVFDCLQENSDTRTNLLPAVRLFG